MTPREFADPAPRLKSAFGGRYTIERELGAGGMATVYLTTDHKHNRDVAVKVMKPELAAEVGRDRFLREIEIVGQLIHPHILPLYDSGVVDDLCYFIMPNIAGDTLRDRLDREGQLPIDEAIRIASEIADGLAYAHSQGVIHRDIKPQNIMLEAGHAVISDFGLALALDGVSANRLTDSGFSVGTPLYMSPEQASAQRRIDGRADIYSLGCVLYEMLAGHPPFQGTTLPAVISQHAVAPPPSLRIVRPTVGERLEAVCFRALAKSPADRFATAEEMMRALTEVSHERVRVGEVGSTGRGAGSPGAGLAVPVDRAGGFVDRIAARLPVVSSQSLLKAAIWIPAGAVLLMVVGFFTTLLYDTQLQIPARFTPSESNYLAVGAQALFPSVVYAFTFIIVALILYYLIRMMAALAGAIPGIGSTLKSSEQRLTTSWNRFWSSARPRTMSDLFLIVAVAISVLGIVLMSPVIGAVYASDSAALGCENRDALRRFQPALTLLILGLATARFQLFRWVRTKTGSVRGCGMGWWGSGALIVLLIILMTVPWRILWADAERVRVGDDRGYVVHETESELVIYNAVEGTTRTYGKADPSAFDRYGIRGYLFEEPHVFESGLFDCTYLD